MKKKKTKKKQSRRYVSEKIDVQQLFPSAEVITAKHWLPDIKETWDQYGDLRERIRTAMWRRDHENTFVVEAATVMDPQKPDPVKVVGANWIHADVHDVLTEETFFEDLARCISEFADMIVEEQNPFQPVRLYKDAEAAYGVGFFDWRGEEQPFDLRALCQFGTWEFTTDQQETVQAAGFRFWLSTLVLPKKEDSDILVGRDMAKAIYGDDIDDN